MKNKKKKLKARDIAKAIIRQENKQNQVANNQQSEAGNGNINNSEENTTDMESVGASRIQSSKNIVTSTSTKYTNSKGGGVRSMSIQNNSTTKVSSFSDATTGGQNYSDSGDNRQ